MYLTLILSRHIDMKYIRLVLTVPAIWGEAAKAFMRKAALNVSVIVLCYKAIYCIIV